MRPSAPATKRESPTASEPAVLRSVRVIASCGSSSAPSGSCGKRQMLPPATSSTKTPLSSTATASGEPISSRLGIARACTPAPGRKRKSCPSASRIVSEGSPAPLAQCIPTGAAAARGSSRNSVG